MLRRILLILFGIILGFLPIEIFLHLKGIPFVGGPGTWRQELFPAFDGSSGRYVGHPYSAYAYRAPVSSWDFFSATGTMGENYINTEGFRNKEEFSLDHPGTFRVLCLGSSTTYGVRNEYENSYPYELQKILAARLPEKVEVLNAGLISSTTAEHIGRLPHKVIPFNPDVVVIYEGFNDLVPRIFNNFKRDYSHFRKTPGRKVPIFFSRIVNSIYTVRYFGYKMQWIPYLTDYIMNLENLPETMEERVRNFNLTSVATYENNLIFLVRTLQAYEIKVILPTFGYSSTSLGEDTWAAMFPRELWDRGISENNSAIQRVQKSFNLPVVDVYKAFLDKAELFQGRIHFTNEGNQTLATVIAEGILTVVHPEHTSPTPAREATH